MMHSFATLIALMTRLLSILTGGVEAGEAAANRRRVNYPLVGEPRNWEQCAAWLGWIPLRARRAPAYVRRMPPETLPHPSLQRPVRR